MICILHGYLLEGSGSYLWTRSIIQSLCRQGETVHHVNHKIALRNVAVKKYDWKNVSKSLLSDLYQLNKRKK